MSKARCPVCGYTEQDQQIHLDHHLCSNAGKAPWEQPKPIESLAQSYANDWFTRAPKYRTKALLGEYIQKAIDEALRAGV